MHGNKEFETVSQSAGASNSKNNYKKPPLHLAAYKGHIDIVNDLLDKGVDPNAIDEDGQTPLHLAAGQDNTDIIKALLDKGGADVNAVEGRNRETALHFAAGFGHKKALELLLAKGAYINAKNMYGETPLYCASQSYHSTDINAENKYDRTSLYYDTSKSHHIEVAKFLIDNGADASIVTKFGYTPLHWWVSKDNLDMVRVLLAAGAGINVANSYGDTALHWASKHSYRSIVMILLAAGADPSLANKDFQAPTDLVQTSGVEEIFENAGIELQEMKNKIGNSGISPIDIVLATETSLIRYAHNHEVYQWLQSQANHYYHNPLKKNQYGRYIELIYDQYHTIRGRICIASDDTTQPHTQLGDTQTIPGGSGLCK